jgi:hypothetical protein
MLANYLNNKTSIILTTEHKKGVSSVQERNSLAIGAYWFSKIYITPIFCFVRIWLRLDNSLDKPGHIYII